MKVKEFQTAINIECPFCHKKKNGVPGKYKCENCSAYFSISETSKVKLLKSSYNDKFETILQVSVILLIIYYLVAQHYFSFSDTILIIILITLAITNALSIYKGLKFNFSHIPIRFLAGKYFHLESEPFLFYLGLVLLSLWEIILIVGIVYHFSL